MLRNIWIAYLLTFLRNSWFWMGIWVFYYLRFTNYAGIGLIETVLIVVMTVSEIPTGVVADLLGKKQTLFLSFLFQTIGLSIMTFTPNALWLGIGVGVLSLGIAFFSGTLDALVYDSLLQIEEQHTFDKVIAKITSISLIAPAVCGVLGGFLYLVKPNVPYILTLLFSLVAIPITFCLKEPNAKKTGFSVRNLRDQTIFGMKELFKTRFLTEQTLLLLGASAISVLCLEMLNDILAVEFGFKPASLAIVWAILYLMCAGISQSTEYIRKFISYEKMGILLGILIGLTLIVSPVGGLVLGGISIAFRAFFQTAYQNVASVLINERIDSQYRTTTLSSFNLLKNIPYVASAYFLGAFADKFTASRLAFFLGIALILFIIPQIFLYTRRRN